MALALEFIKQVPPLVEVWVLAFIKACRCGCACLQFALGLSGASTLALLLLVIILWIGVVFPM
jgi:hypothetical protein